MITAKLYDALTTAVVQRDAVPGLDRLYWREVRTEEGVSTNLFWQLNAAMRDVQEVRISDWPEALCSMAPVDWTDRHEGVAFHLHHDDPVSGAFPEVPLGEARFRPDPDPVLRPQDANVGRLATPDEVRAWARDPRQWTRLPFTNETGGTRLKSPALLRWAKLTGPRYRLRLEDNDVWTPFDLTLTERYRCYDEEGTELDRDLWLSLRQGGDYSLYLRPRRWQWVVIVLAHFLRVTLAEMFPFDEWFLTSLWSRPPFYPYRHDVQHSKLTADLFHPYAPQVYLSWDYGLSWWFEHSQHAADLRQQIVLRTGPDFFCSSVVLIGVEDGAGTVRRETPRAGEVVLGIGRHDRATGQEHRVWVVQVRDCSDLYPRTLIGVYDLPFF